MRSQVDNGPWRTIFHLAKPYRNKFLVVILLAALSTSADLVEPLIYRVAVNDVAGLFVQRAREEGRAESGRSANLRTAKPEERDRGHLEGSRESREPHRRGHVSPRTPSQTLSTLLWAVVLLFVINVVGYFLWLLADNLTVDLGCRIEKSFIYRVFGHVLRLPLNFFAKRASGALAKRIDQLDQVSPIVNAFAQQIAPDVVRVVGILIIMFTQSWRLTLVALITLPPYFWVAQRSASKLERNLSRYYELWEEVSARIQDALAAIKTVKLSGAETREIERLVDVSKTAYDTYVKRTRLANRYLFQEAFLTHLGKALVFGFGGYLALKHALTPGMS